LTSGSDGRPDGTHGTGFRFMPMSAMTATSSPVIVPIAGFIPGCTAQQFSAPVALPFAEPGTWNYFTLQGEAPGGFTVISGDPLLDTHPNTVALVAEGGSLGIEFSDGREHEVLALVDRDDVAVLNPQEMDPQQFYAFADEQELIRVRWCNAAAGPPRVNLVHMCEHY
jgi:hypothetical protein